MLKDYPKYYKSPSRYSEWCAPEMMIRTWYNQRVDYWGVGWILYQFFEESSVIEGLWELD
jgi:hypothetical protein